LIPLRRVLTLGIENEIKIRKAEPSDAAVITDFNVRLAAESEKLHLDRACVALGVAAVLEDPAKGIYFIAEAEGAVAGQLMITYEWSDWRNGNIWWIQSVYVKEEFRRRQVFRKLFDHLVQLARGQKDVCGLRLYMHGDNLRARQTYERLGMKATHYEVFEKELDAEGHGLRG
jgi:GNAT superfamily N-acetyltransferase